MRKQQFSRLSLAVMCALPLAAGAQEGLRLKSQPTLTLRPPAADEALPLFFEADRLQGRNDRETEAEGNVRLRRRGQAVSADRLRYEKSTDELAAEGSVRLESGPDVVEGERLQYNLGSSRGFMERPAYTLRKSALAPGERQPFQQTDARGTAERLLFEGPGRYRAQRTQYTACEPGNDDWYLRARELTIDKERDVGVARDASIAFMGVPIFYTPYFTFSLNQQRKSGFLTPHYGNTTTGGAELTVPYYWNIAPNRDATISPRFMTRRGVQLGNEFRYLDPSYLGETRVEVLPEDNARNGEQRWAYNVRHNQSLPQGWSGALRLQRVSDDTYFTDLSTQIAVTSQVLLPSEGVVSRIGPWGGAGRYGLSALVQRWQTLQVDPLAPVTPPYNRLPQLTLTGARQDLRGADFDFYGQFVGFDHPTLVEGKRTLAYPSMSLPLQSAYGYVTPKLGVNATRYAIGRNAGGFTDRDRTLPIFSTDSGMVFERPTSFGVAPYLQTLEPRLYYVYIPFRDQSGIPVFDSGPQDVNFATMYSENQFAGWDRINDANQVTAGVTSRFIGSETGAERLRVGIAQRYYFSSQQVTLPGVPARTSNNSDLLAALSGTIVRNWTADAGLQFSTYSSQTQKLNVGTRYQPRPGSVLNLSYRETRDTLRQTDISTQWPLRAGWSGLARWNYSLLDNRTIEALLGVEYGTSCGCWSLRVVAHRFAITTEQATTTFFIQLELNGVSRIGSNPLETLRRSIGGYASGYPSTQRPDENSPTYY